MRIHAMLIPNEASYLPMVIVEDVVGDAFKVARNEILHCSVFHYFVSNPRMSQSSDRVHNSPVKRHSLQRVDNSPLNVHN